MKHWCEIKHAQVLINSCCGCFAVLDMANVTSNLLAGGIGRMGGIDFGEPGIVFSLSLYCYYTIGPVVPIVARCPHPGQAGAAGWKVESLGLFLIPAGKETSRAYFIGTTCVPDGGLGS